MTYQKVEKIINWLSFITSVKQFVKQDSSLLVPSQPSNPTIADKTT